MGEPIDDQLAHIGQAERMTATGVIACAYGRGSDELVHRSFKDFGHAVG